MRPPLPASRPNVRAACSKSVRIAVSVISNCTRESTITLAYSMADRRIILVEPGLQLILGLAAQHVVNALDDIPGPDADIFDIYLNSHVRLLVGSDLH